MAEHPELGIIQTHLELALGSFLTALYRQPGWMGGYSTDIEDHFWTFIIPVTATPDTEIDEAIQFFNRFDRTPTLYGETAWLEDRQNAVDVSILDQQFTDSWMEFTGSIDQPSSTYNYVTVNSNSEKKQFLDIFQQAFGETDSDDEPYSNLPDGYRRGVRRALDGAWGASHNLNILVRHQGEAAGIGTLAMKNDTAYIYNIATRPDRQGEGIGTASTKKLVTAAQELDAERIILQTEAESYVQQFYENLGFEQLFTMEGLTGIDRMTD